MNESRLKGGIPTVQIFPPARSPLRSPSPRPALRAPGCKQSFELRPSRARRSDPSPPGRRVEETDPKFGPSECDTPKTLFPAPVTRAVGGRSRAGSRLDSAGPSLPGRHRSTSERPASPLEPSPGDGPFRAGAASGTELRGRRWPESGVGQVSLRRRWWPRRSRGRPRLPGSRGSPRVRAS